MPNHSINSDVESLTKKLVNSDWKGTESAHAKQNVTRALKRGGNCGQTLPCVNYGQEVILPISQTSAVVRGGDKSRLKPHVKVTEASSSLHSTPLPTQHLDSLTGGGGVKKKRPNLTISIPLRMV